VVSFHTSIRNVVCATLFAGGPLATAALCANHSQPSKLLIAVMDENRLPVSSARLMLEQTGAPTVLRGETDFAGRYEFINLRAGAYRLRVEKEGFYALTLSEVHAGETESVEVTLNHHQEYSEVVDVVYSPPAIDPTATAATARLSSREIISLPYPTTRDIRNALPLLPGVLQDHTGQVHVEGAASGQTLYRLDGFNIAQPVTGWLNLRVSSDAVRSIEMEGSRLSAESGKGTGGSMHLTTGMGDDRFRFSATDFIPSFQSTGGRITLDNATPRANFSGPLRRGRAWFLDAADGEYGLTIVPELPRGADESTLWRLSNLAKVQVNLSPANRLIASFLVNRSHSEHDGLSRFTPREATTNMAQSAYLFTVKEQVYTRAGLLVEFGFGVNQYFVRAQPQGTLPYVIRPGGQSGNFYKASEARARRWQWIGNLFFPPVQRHGRHELRVGAEVHRIGFDQSAIRRPFSILRADGTLLRAVQFAGSARGKRSVWEASAYFQDRWSPSGRWLLEFGIRLDSDTVLGRAWAAPRFASSYMLTRDGNTKLSFGVGLFYDATSLDHLTRPQAGQRLDTLYATDGLTPVAPPAATSFQADERDLRPSRSLNWSVGLERKLPAAAYLDVEFLQKRGRHGFAYFPSGGALGGTYLLRSARRDRYDAVRFKLRWTHKESWLLFAAYTRSAARTSAVLDFDIDNPVFAAQAGGPLPWDAPARFQSWGSLLLPKKLELSYSLEWRDGFPFSMVNQLQQLVGPPASSRFPAYFALNLHVERRFRWLGFQWALRGGFNNLTNRANPTVVDNNVDSPQFLTFGGIQRRALIGRIRFLGRK